MKRVVEQELEVGMRRIIPLLIGIFIVACAREPVGVQDQIGGTLRNLMQYQEDGNYAFDCSVTGFIPTSYNWDFGDGVKRVTEHKGVAHTYNESGTYFVSCTASDGTSNITTNATVTATLPETLREDVEALSDVYPPNSYINTTGEFDLGLFEDLETYERETPRDDFEELDEYDWEDTGYEWEEEEYELDETSNDVSPNNSTNVTTDTGHGTASGTNSTTNASRTNTTLPAAPINNTPGNDTIDGALDDGFDLDILEDHDEESDEENGESDPAGGRDNGDDEDGPGMDEEEQEDDDRKDREQRDEKAEVAPKSKKIKVEVLLS